MAKEVMLMPPAELAVHAGDLPLTDEQFLQLSFFTGLTRKPGIDRFPGALRLRRFKKGESICRQGDTGWTAFFALTSEDARQLLLERLKMLPPGGERAVVERELAEVEKRLTQLNGDTTHPLRALATVQLRLARPSVEQKPTLFGRLAQLFRPSAPASGEKRRFIPIGGSVGVVPYDTRQATMFEGDVFGEMSCMYGFPRSATVIAQRDCYVLEMLRNILDQAWRDTRFEEKMDRLYKERVLQNHLRGLPVFGELTEEEYLRIRDQVELLRFGDGEIICDQNERSDGMYIIRSGMVKVVRNSSALFGSDDVKNWPALLTHLQTCAVPENKDPRQAVWLRLPDSLRETVQKTGSMDALSSEVRQELLNCLNEQIKDGKFRSEAALKEHAAAAIIRAQVGADPKKWDAQEIRRVNRQIMQALFPDIFRSHNPAGEYIAAYCSRGEFIGEISLLTNATRSATCLAYVHPEPQDGAQAGVWRRDAKQVELVRISSEVFRELLATSPGIRQKVEAIAEQRQKHDRERARAPQWSDVPGTHLSEEFEQLGLIQGQKLMLIDLDRCTRCDECVRACIDTHQDGHTRLFLDGPRFGNYLVPTTCRSCCDPVCMIGCPVGSIHRGNNGQIVIEDWCIGCQLCARNCPYGAIQMHDIGIIPGGAFDWHWSPATAGADTKWTQPNYYERGWEEGRAPFINDYSFRARLQSSGCATDAGLRFRYAFWLEKEAVRSGSEFALELTSADDAATVWINGVAIQADGPAKRSKRMFSIPGSTDVFRSGQNVVAVQVNANVASGEPLLDLRLDEIHHPEMPDASAQYVEKPVSERAVVCDLCSKQFGQKPACVTACPHDAAIRVNARFEFPGAK